MADIRRLNRTVDRFTDDKSYNNFQFRRGDPHRLIACLDLPPAVRCSNGRKFSGEEAVLISLFRLAHPGKLTEVRTVFGRDETQLFRLFNWTMRFLYQRFNCLLSKSLTLWAPYFERWADSIEQKWDTPAHRELVCSSVDGTVTQICRSGVWSMRSVRYECRSIWHWACQSVCHPLGLLCITFDSHLVAALDCGSMLRSWSCGLPLTLRRTLRSCSGS